MFDDLGDKTSSDDSFIPDEDLKHKLNRLYRNISRKHERVKRRKAAEIAEEQRQRQEREEERQQWKEMQKAMGTYQRGPDDSSVDEEAEAEANFFGSTLLHGHLTGGAEETKAEPEATDEQLDQQIDAAVEQMDADEKALAALEEKKRKSKEKAAAATEATFDEDGNVMMPSVGQRLMAAVKGRFCRVPQEEEPVTNDGKKWYDVRSTVVARVGAGTCGECAVMRALRMHVCMCVPLYSPISVSVFAARFASKVPQKGHQHVARLLGRPQEEDFDQERHVEATQNAAAHQANG